MQWAKYGHLTVSGFFKEDYNLRILEWQQNYKPFKKNLIRIINYL